MRRKQKVKLIKGAVNVLHLLIIVLATMWTVKMQKCSFDYFGLYLNRLEYQFNLEEIPVFFGMNMLYQLYAFIGMVVIAVLTNSFLKRVFKFDIIEWMLSKATL